MQIQTRRIKNLGFPNFATKQKHFKMKNKLTYLIIATAFILTGSLTSCSKVTDLLEITLEDFAYSVEVPVEIETTKGSGYAFNGTGSFDPNASPGDESFGKIIKQVDLKSISIFVSSLTASSEVIIEDAVFVITDDETGKSLTFEITEPITIYFLTEFTIDPNTPNFSVLVEILKDLHPATISINGHINQNEIALTFMYSILADLTLGV